MKQRLLVMNGQRLVQTEQGGEWKNQKVDKAGALRPGIYNLYTAQHADKKKAHNGTILYFDGKQIYQQTDKGMVAHNREDFDKIPEAGKKVNVSYNDAGRAALTAETATLSRGRSR